MGDPETDPPPVLERAADVILYIYFLSLNFSATVLKSFYSVEKVREKNVFESKKNHSVFAGDDNDFLCNGMQRKSCVDTDHS